MFRLVSRFTRVLSNEPGLFSERPNPLETLYQYAEQCITHKNTDCTSGAVQCTSGECTHDTPHRTAPDVQSSVLWVQSQNA
ncbi:unnamed protein product [Caenorhabditis auriculariae]|uniref:Uncharacterized protein n=1 Tax=Caenorhabditis auriculariae TaxID=2777116 RepID=A0A8S1HII2_9PELO|nr:unnamed protein product [Caenorhabditis auriculariae]